MNDARLNVKNRCTPGPLKQRLESDIGEEEEDMKKKQKKESGSSVPLNRNTRAIDPTLSGETKRAKSVWRDQKGARVNRKMEEKQPGSGVPLNRSDEGGKGVERRRRELRREVLLPIVKSFSSRRSRQVFQVSIKSLRSRRSC